MANESSVATPPDSTGTGAHNIRTITVSPDNSNVVAGGQAEQQQVVTLGDTDGHILRKFEDGALPVSSREFTELLHAIVLRLDLLLTYTNSHYTPPDHLGIH